jgi:hypothetical protein
MERTRRQIAPIRLSNDLHSSLFPKERENVTPNKTGRISPAADEMDNTRREREFFLMNLSPKAIVEKRNKYVKPTISKILVVDMDDTKAAQPMTVQMIAINIPKTERLVTKIPFIPFRAFMLGICLYSSIPPQEDSDPSIKQVLASWTEAPAIFRFDNYIQRRTLLL